MPATITEEADFVVVGSGAGGATVAKTLAVAGAAVVVVEEGPRFAVAERGPDMTSSLARAYRDCGMTVMRGRSYIPYIQGRCLGGTTVVNGAIMWRLPEDILAGWLAADRGLASVFSPAALERCFDVIERDISVRPVDAAIEGGNNSALRRGAEALGWAGRIIRRNERGCLGSARCMQGCPNHAKQSMELTYLPEAERHGARIYADVRVEAIRSKRGRVVGVSGVQRPAEEGAPSSRFTAAARRGVVISAGAIQTAALLQRNRIGNSQVGERLTCNPGVSASARFAEPVAPWRGATQGYEVTELRSERVKLESLGLPPDFAAMRLPGAGADLARRIAALPRCATAGAAIRAHGTGTVRAAGRRGVAVRYRLAERDVQLFGRGLWALAEVYRAAGAEALITGVHGWPAELDAREAPEWIAAQRIDERQLKIAVTHLFGGACAGADPARAVVSPELAVHGVDGLYVADASVLPGNTGVNPQETIMAFAMAAAERWVGG